MHVLSLPQATLAYWSPCCFLCQASEWKLWFRVNRAHVKECTPLLRVSQKRAASGSDSVPFISNKVRKNSKQMSVAEHQHGRKKSKDFRYSWVTAHAQVLRWQNTTCLHFQVSVTESPPTRIFYRINFCSNLMISYYFTSFTSCSQIFKKKIRTGWDVGQ